MKHQEYEETVKRKERLELIKKRQERLEKYFPDGYDVSPALHIAIEDIDFLLELVEKHKQV
jgi:hypothetical protein